MVLMGRQAGTVVLANTYCGSPRSDTLPQNIYSGFCEWGLWAGTPAQWFWQIPVVAPQDQAHRHKIYIVDFVNGANGQARRHSGFGKYLLGLPKIRHAATK